MGDSTEEGPASYTKIDVAESLIKTAVRLFFEDDHPIPVHLLAASAREIMTTLGDVLGIKTILHGMAEDFGITLKDAHRKAHDRVGFFKHADHDPTGVLNGFSDVENDHLLLLACHDFGRVTKGMPIEAQVFECWYWAVSKDPVQKRRLSQQILVRQAIRCFPIGMRGSGRAAQKRMGLETLRTVVHREDLRMEFKRIVDLPEIKDR